MLKLEIEDTCIWCGDPAALIRDVGAPELCDMCLDRWREEVQFRKICHQVLLIPHPRALKVTMNFMRKIIQEFDGL